jgi:hypothetical protein
MKSLHTIPSQSFQNCSSLQTIDMPNVENIGGTAFQNCTKLKDFNFKNCKNIGNFAFNKCVSLVKINLYNCTSIGKSTFAECRNLKEVYINNPNNIKCILENVSAFEHTHEGINFYFRPEILGYYMSAPNWEKFKNQMKSIPQNNQIIYTTSTKESITGNNPNSPNPIDNNGYDTKLNYGWVTFRNKVENLNIGIFNMDSTYRGIITHVQIPPECVYIGDNLFEDCTQLKEIKLSDTLTDIGAYTFKNCEALESFEIPESLNRLGEGAFAGCKNITKFSGNKQFITNGDFVVFNNTLICVLPITTTKIYKIPKYITRLGMSCFHGCDNMKVVDIPSNITSIGDNAFAGCTNLCEVHFNGDTPPTLGTDVFKDCLSSSKDFKIFVPKTSEETYKNKYSNFSQYIHTISTNCEAFVVSDGETIMEVKNKTN